MKKKTLKALSKINNFLDDDYQKLYDKYESLKLSHNRKVKLLKKVFPYLFEYQVLAYTSDHTNISDQLDKLLSSIKVEVVWNGRAYMKRIKNG